MTLAARAACPFPLTATVSSLFLATLAACGGGDTAPAPTPAPPPPPVVASLTGTVAVGAPIVDGKLRVVDADGSVVAQDVPIDADGHYSDVVLTGRGPWRLEACGYAGGQWRCIYAIAQASGTANVTPLTTAQVTLATGATPEQLMNDDAVLPDADALATAQQQLQAGLAGTLADAGLSGTVDFTTGTLTAGSRTGYDRVLDAISVTTGTDGDAFVQLQPRLGDGNLYMTTDATVGAITPVAGAATLPLGSLETLFTGMSAAMANSTACSGGSTNLAQWISTDARMNMGGGLATGRDTVASQMCAFFGGAGEEGEALWGARLDSPVLGHCDLSGTDPVCAVTFVLHKGEDVSPVGDGMGVVFQGGRWLFRGDLLPVEIHANATVQRSVRVDDGSAPRYSRALQFDIGVTPGVACVQVSQRDAAGSPTTVAYYKVYEPGARRMSLWQSSDPITGDRTSLDPAHGRMNGSDSTWMMLPEGSDGDEVVRNFYRGGRTVEMSLFSDAACSVPAVVDGRSGFTVDVQGVPPVWSAMPGLAWGDLTEAARASLQAFTLGAGTDGSFAAAWTASGYGQVTFCVDGQCGGDSPGRLADRRLLPSSRDATLELRGPANAVTAGSFKMLAFYGRDNTGLAMQTNYMSCSGTPAGEGCR